MKSFTENRLSEGIPPHISWLISECTEARGKQDLWKALKPETLRSLKEMAIIQSVESSNRIEGVVAEEGRLKPLLSEASKPKDRPEEELLGYKKALDLIHANYKNLTFSPDLLLRFHKTCQGGLSGDAGKWKETNNEIIELLPNGDRQIRFVPTPAEDTPHQIEQLVLAYKQQINKDSYPDLITISATVFDFLCIHPFRDGNGRVSRLLTLLLLYKSGYEVGSYVSLERIIEENKESYYKVLAQSSEGWHQANHSLGPWFQYFFSTIKEAYRELSDRVNTLDPKSSKTDEITRTILNQGGEFTSKDIEKILPHVSLALIKRTLTHLRDVGEIILEGKGRGARWKLNPEIHR